MGSNKFNRALGHLKSTSIDEKIRLLDEQPTNNTTQIYIDEPDTIKTITLNPNLNPVDLTQDADVNGRDTTGLFMPDGTILTEEPPGDTSYILGPMAAMYYTWSYPWTMIGYIRQSDRRMVNLARVDGKLSDWDGSSGFNSYGQLTLEQAVWFRDIQKQPGATNDPSTYNYYAFYPGPPSQFPDAYGRYPCVITGVSKNRSSTTGSPATDRAKGINPEWGLSGYMFVKVGDKWEKKYYYDDGTVSSERSGEMTPDNPFYDAYQRGGGDQAAENGYSREEIIRAGNEQIQREIAQQAQQDYQDTLRNMPDKPLTIDDFNSAADYSAYKNGGGDAARALGKSVEEIINQGIQNLNQYSQDPRISDRMRQDAQRADLNNLMNKPPGSHTPAERQALLDAGLDDFVQGGKTASPLGDLAMLGATYGVVKGALALGLGGLAKLGLTGTAAGIGQQAKETFADKANNSGQYNKQLAGKLVSSIISGQPQEIKLTPAAKKSQINSVDRKKFAELLTTGGPAPKPSANSTVNPKNKGPLLTGGWGTQGASEVHYDPKTDTLTITSEKMLRTGQPGDKFGIGQYGNPLNPITYQKQTAFGDIPEPTDAQVSDITKNLMTGPLEPLMQGFSNVAQVLYTPSNTSNFTGGPLPGRERTSDVNTWDQIKSDPYLLQNFSDNIGKASNDLAKGAVQGTASNTVAFRKALTNLGVPQSEIEKTGGGYGQVFSQTEYKGNQIPQNLRDIINKKTVQTESYTRKRILREIKNEVVLPDEKKEKLKGYRPKPFGKLHAQYDKLMQKAENPASFKPMDETAWTKQDKYYNARLSQERKNEVLDHLGTGDHYWEILTETGRKRSEKGLKEKYGDFTLVRKEQMVGDTLLFLVDEHGKKETILQSEYSDRIARQMEEPLWEQETLNAPNDPLIKRVKNKIATQIDYPEKPSRMGYPDGPTPQQVAGWHPEYGKRAAYYNALDPQSADSMPATGDPETDQKVAAQKTPLTKKTKKELKAEARLIQSDWKNEIQIPEKKLEEEVPKFRKLLDVTKERGVVSEKMTSSGAGLINLIPQGDVDIIDTDTTYNNIVSDLSQNTLRSGNTITLQGSENQIVGGTHTYYNTARFDVDGTRASHAKITISKGGGTSSWTDRNGASNFDDHVSLIITNADDFFAPEYNDSNLSSGTHIIPLPGNYKNLRISLQQFGKVGETGALTISNVSLQRRTPLNVIVSLDDPEASAFIRDGQTSNLSPEEKRKKLEKQLATSKEYLDKMFGDGMPGTSTEIADYEPQQSFMDIQVGDERITKKDGKTVTDTTRGIEDGKMDGKSTYTDNQGNMRVGEPTPTPTPTPQPTSTPTKSAVPNLYQNKSAAWISGSISSSSEEFLKDQFRGTTVNISNLMSLGKEIERLDKFIGRGQGTEKALQRAIDRRNNFQERLKAEIDGSTPNYKSIIDAPKASDDRSELEKNIEASLKQLEIDSEQLRGEALRRNIDLAISLGLDILTVITMFTPIPGDEAAALSAQAAKSGVKTGAKTVAQQQTVDAFRREVTSVETLTRAQQAINRAGSKFSRDVAIPIKVQGKTINVKANEILRSKGFRVNSYQPQGKVLSERKRLKSPKSIVDKIPGYYEGKPAPLGFPIEEPPKMKNGYHPDLVTPEGQEKQSNRYNRMDQATAKATPMTGNPYIDKKVLKARNQPK